MKHPLANKMEAKYRTFDKKQQELVWNFADLTKSVPDTFIATVMRFMCIEFQDRLNKNQIPITPEEEIIGGD